MITAKPIREGSAAVRYILIAGGIGIDVYKRQAWDYRKQVMAGGNDNVPDLKCCRVIFGEADFLPGITVDKYADVLVVECLALGMEQFKVKIVDLLKEVLASDGINIRGVYERSDANERKKEGLPKVKGFIAVSYTHLFCHRR